MKAAAAKLLALSILGAGIADGTAVSAETSLLAHCESSDHIGPISIDVYRADDANALNKLSAFASRAGHTATLIDATLARNAAGRPAIIFGSLWDLPPMDAAQCRFVGSRSGGAGHLKTQALQAAGDAPGFVSEFEACLYWISAGTPTAGRSLADLLASREALPLKAHVQCIGGAGAGPSGPGAAMPCLSVRILEHTVPLASGAECSLGGQ